MSESREMQDAAERYWMDVKVKRAKTGAPVNCPYCASGNIQAEKLETNRDAGISGVTVKCSDCGSGWIEV